MLPLPETTSLDTPEGVAVRAGRGRSRLKFHATGIVPGLRKPLAPSELTPRKMVPPDGEIKLPIPAIATQFAKISPPMALC